VGQRGINGVDQVLDALEPPKQVTMGDDFGSVQENDYGR